MKKAKVLVPALGMLCLSAVACVTGTVAWFTSVTNASIKTTEFTVKSVEGSMSVKATAGIGTKINTLGDNADESASISPDENESVTNSLTHGSFDPSKMQAWNVNKYDSSAFLKVGEGKDFTKTNEADFAYDGIYTQFHIFSWDLEFNYDFRTNKNANPMELYFDDSSTATTTGFDPSTASSTANDSARGFRMAFINLDDTTTDESGTNYNTWMVWSPFQIDKLAQNAGDTKPDSCYVSSETGTTPYIATSTGNLKYYGDGATNITSVTGDNTRKEYLGKFTPTLKTGSDSLYEGVIKIRIVCWYEGCDDNVTNQSNLNNPVQTTVKFYLRDAVKTA